MMSTIIIKIDSLFVHFFAHRNLFGWLIENIKMLLYLNVTVIGNATTK